MPTRPPPRPESTKLEGTLHLESAVVHGSTAGPSSSSTGARSTAAPDKNAAPPESSAAPTTPRSEIGTKTARAGDTIRPAERDAAPPPSTKGSASSAPPTSAAQPSSSSARRAATQKHSTPKPDDDTARKKENDAWVYAQWNRQQEEIATLRGAIKKQAEQIEALRKGIGQLDTAPMRAQIVRELAKLLPAALARARAKNGSPALLRLIIRSLKSL